MPKIITYKDLAKQRYNKMYISRLIQKKQLGNLGFNLYTYKSNILHLESDKTMIQINNFLLKTFPFPPKRVLFSSISLNFCINQLITSTTYIVEVEKEYLQATFELLKNNFNNIVLLKPTDKDKINYWKPGAIYIVELFKRSPIKKGGSIAIEKLIFDLLFDKNICSLYSGQDITFAIETLCTKYTINYKTLFAYARRRNKINELLKAISRFIPKEVMEKINNAK